MCVKDWTSRIDVVAIKWQDVSDECRFTAFSDPAEALNASSLMEGSSQFSCSGGISFPQMTERIRVCVSTLCLTRENQGNILFF